MQAAAGIENPKQRAEALRGVAVALAGAGQAAPAMQAAADIENPKQRAEALTALLPNSALSSRSDREFGRRALELLLFTSNAPDYIAAFPIMLLRRLVANGDLEVDERQPVRPPIV
jgi:hypothetical protein